MKKTEKPLTREQYLKKFSRSVRWRLTPQEAAEAIADYREMVYQPEREESKLVEELGAPVRAARLLTDVKTYRRWLAVFAVLAFGLFWMVKWCWTGRIQIYEILGKGCYWYPVWVMMAGLVLSQYWFRRHRQKSGPLSKRLILGSALVLAAGAVIVGWAWHVTGPGFSERIIVEPYGGPLTKQVWVLQFLLRYGGCACTLTALAGLVLAKCYDRRWLALYALALTVAVLCVILVFWTSHIDLTRFGSDELRIYYFPRMVLVGTAGLIGTGVALC